MWLLLLCSTVEANQYCLFGGGNCTYFAVEFMERFWPTAPDVDGDWDAHQWVDLIGVEQEGYCIVQVTNPQIGDVFIFPKSKKYPRGHVGIISGVECRYDFKAGSTNYIYTTMESSMWPNGNFPYLLNRCHYRFTTYDADTFARNNATFITCTQINKKVPFNLYTLLLIR
jgi:hypothetical protein